MDTESFVFPEPLAGNRVICGSLLLLKAHAIDSKSLKSLTHLGKLGAQCCEVLKNCGMRTVVDFYLFFFFNVYIFVTTVLLLEAKRTVFWQFENFKINTFCVRYNLRLTVLGECV